MDKLPTLLVPGKASASGAGPGETPLAYIQRWVRRRMPEFGGHTASLADRVLIVQSRTGSGKSTVLPVGLFRLLRGEGTATRVRFRGPGVVCTQPRVLTAESLAKDVSGEGGAKKLNRDMVLGETVGYQTGPITNRPQSGLVYVTAGVLAAQLRQQEDTEIMGRYWCIIVDEAHERSLDSDMTLMLLRNFYQRNVGNPRLPFLLLASATFDPARYAAYFGVGGANVVVVEGRAFEIETHWPAQGANDYWAEAVATAVRIHEEHPDDPPERADVLIFAPGAREAAAITIGLAKANMKYIGGAPGAPDAEAGPPGAGPPDADAGPPDADAGPLGPMLVLQLNREIVNSQSGDYHLAFEPRPAALPAVGGRRPLRRVVVATTVAETGLTLPKLRYVIDGGWSRSREVYQPWGLEGVVTRPAPQSRIEQRKGRAGRLFPGDFYPLYTENVFRALDAQQLPDIYTAGPASIHLAMIQEQQRQKLRTGQLPEFRVEDLTLLDPPAPEAFLAVNATAVALGFVSASAALPGRWPPADPAAAGPAPADPAPRGYGLTELGHLAASFMRTSMEGVRIILAGYIWGASATDLATAVALLGGGSIWARRAKAKGNLPAHAEALRAALPSYLVQRVGGGGERALPPAESEAFYFRARLLISDDFAEAVLCYDAFARRVEGSRGDLGAVAAWCEESGLDFGALVEVTGRRETVQEEMVVAGLNPFRAFERRLAALPAEAFTDGLSRFKRCLYDGLRGQLLRYAPEHPAGPAYVTRQGLRVKIPDLLSDALAARFRALGVSAQGAADAKPRWLITDQIRLAPAPAGKGGKIPLLFQVEAGLVSVMDGYVNVDPDFGGPRRFAGGVSGTPP